MPLDPRAEYAVLVYTRSLIADDLNNCLEQAGEEPQFKPDDDRLTDLVCQDFANGLATLLAGDDVLATTQAEQTLRDLGLLPEAED